MSSCRIALQRQPNEVWRELEFRLTKWEKIKIHQNNSCDFDQHLVSFISQDSNKIRIISSFSIIYNYFSFIIPKENNQNTNLYSMQAPHPESKIILLGDFGVGKTSIFRRYSQGTFVDTSEMDWNQYRESTLGLDNYSKKFECNTGNNTGIKRISLRLFDTGGLERIGSISNSYYKFSEAVLLVFAKNSNDSFNCLTQHLLEVLSFAENAKLYLVCNKVDLNECEVTDGDVRTFMEQFPNIEDYFQVSCKTNQPSVDDMFCKIAQKIANSANNKLAYRLDSIKLTNSPINSSLSYSQDNSGPSYEHQYERNADFHKANSSCSSCMGS